jgi:hypothetical protein
MIGLIQNLALEYPILAIGFFALIIAAIGILIYRFMKDGLYASKVKITPRRSIGRSDRTVSLIAGAFFLLLSIPAAMGSVSLGAYHVPVQGGVDTGSFLVTNYTFVLLALGLASLSAFFFYRAGKESVPRPVIIRMAEEERKANSIRV